MASEKKRSGKSKKTTMAQRADRHRLYEDAVQCVEAEIDFVDETFQELRGRKAKWLREDFCGTGNTSCEWVRRRRTNHAIGVDLDAGVQQWGRDHHIAKLTSGAQKRIELVEANVMHIESRPMDVVLGMNFSYWIFKERQVLRRYFRRVLEGLADDGVLMLDSYGGSDVHKELRERKEKARYTYIWHQKSYDPINAHLLCHIHFSFPDGSRLNEAFTYDWRVWTLPEIREILLEAGFNRVTVYWEGTDEDGDGDGVFTPATVGEADAAFVVYIVAEK
jgi:cyclopropane fatty-acyl-phospholipid synthase-like methyltransferase